MSNTPAHAAATLWSQRGLTALLAALALGGGVFWVMQILALGQADPHVRFVSAPGATGDGASLGRVLGANSAGAVASAPAPSTLSLVAVIARGTQAGSAMISINGQKAQAYGPGDEVQTGRYVVELGLRQVGLGASAQGPVTEVIELKVPRLPN